MSPPGLEPQGIGNVYRNINEPSEKITTISRVERETCLFSKTGLTFAKKSLLDSLAERQAHRVTRR